MAIYKRKNVWWASYKDPNGNRIQRSLGTKIHEDAERAYAEIVKNVWDVKRTGKKESRTWQEAVVRFLKEKGHKKSLATDIARLKILHRYLHGLYLEQITLDKVNQLKEDYLSTGVKHSTANRVLALLRSVLRAAKNDWEWLDKIPAIRLLPEPTRRIRWLKPEELNRLLAELPEHLSDMALFSVATGLRDSNVTGLKWDQVDLQRSVAWVYGDESKNGEALAIPLNQNAVEIIRRQLGKHMVYVFTYNGEKVARANNSAWRKALVRAGIKDFRWHDLRHCFASYHVMAGTPTYKLKELGGWKSEQMVRRYAHLSAEHLAEYAGNSVTFLLHKGKTD